MEITVGEDYAYHSSGAVLAHPLRATVIALHEGSVSVQLHHPDHGDSTVEVPFEDLAGAWNELPGEMMPEADRTWAEIAQQNYDEVLRQRVLAARLSELGIHREPKPYAQRMCQARTNLTLSKTELANLVTLAERYVAQNLDTVMIQA